MKTTDGMTGRCPKCGGRVTVDHKRRGFVRHIDRLINGVKCRYGWKQRD